MKTNKVPKNIETKFNAINNELLSCSKKLLDDEYYDKWVCFSDCVNSF